MKNEIFNNELINECFDKTSINYWNYYVKQFNNRVHNRCEKLLIREEKLANRLEQSYKAEKAFDKYSIAIKEMKWVSNPTEWERSDDHDDKEFSYVKDWHNKTIKLEKEIQSIRDEIEMIIGELGYAATTFRSAQYEPLAGMLTTQYKVLDDLYEATETKINDILQIVPEKHYL